jgi:hypothetical protein
MSRSMARSAVLAMAIVVLVAPGGHTQDTPDVVPSRAVPRPATWSDAAAAGTPPEVLGRVVERREAPSAPSPTASMSTGPRDAPPEGGSPATTTAAAPPEVGLPAPVGVTATPGPGSATVRFDPVPGATSYTARASDGSTATGASSPITVLGLASGVSYTFTVTAESSDGQSPESAPSGPVVPTGPVTNSVALAAGRVFVNQSTSFTSSPGTLSSRRPQATEPSTTSLFSPPVSGLPAGVEWRLLWLRATNCEAAARPIEFFLQDEISSVTVARFVPGDMWVAGQPDRRVAVDVAPAGEIAWHDTTASPVIVPPGHSIGVRWHAMGGGAASCNWQFAAIQQPAGTGLRTGGPAVSSTSSVSRSFGAHASGLRASWQTVPAGAVWIPQSVTATNCETGPRQMEIVLLGPGAITMGVLGMASNGAGPATIPPGGTLTWSSAPVGRPGLVLPSGWSLGVRWLDMTGGQPDLRCEWSATVAVAAAGAAWQE